MPLSLPRRPCSPASQARPRVRLPLPQCLGSSSKGPHPVYVWIHGGSFTGGMSFSPMFDGTMLAQEGVVCVTVAYRLGAFGFLDLGPLLGSKYAGSANNGVRDLIAALDWVKQNIESFGGDPSLVTVGASRPEPS